MSTIDRDPFFQFLVDTNPVVGSYSYTNALISRLLLDQKGTPIETDDYPYYSEAIEYCLRLMEASAEQLKATAGAEEAVATVLGFADTLYSLAIDTTFLEQEGWLHSRIFHDDDYNPLLDYENPENGVAA